MNASTPPYTSIFLRSYASDLPWMPYALRSIRKFVTGIDETIISVPPHDYAAFKKLDLDTKREHLMPSQVPDRNGYMDQQADKLRAHNYTGADYILFWDSDVIATRPFSPSDLMINGLPRCLMTPYDKLVNKDGTPATPWQPVVSKALRLPVAYEYMRSHPFLVPRSALIWFSAYMRGLHGVPIGRYISEQPDRSFSEFNCLMAWAHHHKPDLFSWWDTEVMGVPEPFVKQFWSYSGLTDAERAEMEKILT